MTYDISDRGEGGGTVVRNTTKEKLAADVGIWNFQCILVRVFLCTQDNVLSMLVCEQEVKCGLLC